MKTEWRKSNLITQMRHEVQSASLPLRHFRKSTYPNVDASDVINALSDISQAYIICIFVSFIMLSISLLRRSTEHFNDPGFPLPGQITRNIKVLHEKCGKSSIQSKGNSYSEWITYAGVSCASPPHLMFMFTITLSFIVLTCYALAQKLRNCVAQHANRLHAYQLSLHSCRFGLA